MGVDDSDDNAGDDNTDPPELSCFLSLALLLLNQTFKKDKIKIKRSIYRHFAFQAIHIYIV